jgi:CheY-like chemotaxis protein
VAFVEDDPDLREAVAAYFKVSGYATAQFESAIEALEALREHPVDVVVTDLGLGRGNGGRELAHALRADPRTRGIRLLCLTGDIDAASTERVFDAVMAKPVDLDELVDAVRKLLPA